MLHLVLPSNNVSNSQYCCKVVFVMSNSVSHSLSFTIAAQCHYFLFSSSSTNLAFFCKTTDYFSLHIKISSFSAPLHFRSLSSTSFPFLHFHFKYVCVHLSGIFIPMQKYPPLQFFFLNISPQLFLKKNFLKAFQQIQVAKSKLINHFKTAIASLLLSACFSGFLFFLTS